jgi:hypothetical protein
MTSCVKTCSLKFFFSLTLSLPETAEIKRLEPEIILPCFLFYMKKLNPKT